jgi:hypothetical protein
LSASTIAAIYRERWQIELFFKWIGTLFFLTLDPIMPQWETRVVRCVDPSL